MELHSSYVHPTILSDQLYQQPCFSLCGRFRHQGALADLDEATELHRVALSLRPSSRSLRFMSQQPCHQSSKNVPPHLTWMREAIELYRAAITLRPPNHLRRSAFLYHLTINLETRFEQ